MTSSNSSPREVQSAFFGEPHELREIEVAPNCRFRFDSAIKKWVLLAHSLISRLRRIDSHRAPRRTRLACVAFTHRLFHLFQELYRRNHLEPAKPPSEILTHISVARHQIKQISIAADKVIGLRLDC